MSADDTGRLIYLLLLGFGIGGWFLVQNRRNLGKSMQHAMIWGFIFVGVVAVIGLWEDVNRTTSRDQITRLDDGRIAVRRQSDGHYYLTAEVNDAGIRFVVDTGASDIVLTRKDAIRAGLEPDTLNFFGRANTANGVVETAPVRLEEVMLGGFSDYNVPAVVNGGEMKDSLLGMGYLQRWGRIEIADGELILTR